MRPYLRVANVFEDRIDTSDLKEMDFSGCFERYRLAPGDVLLNEGQSPELLGRPAIYRGEPRDVAFTNTLIRFRPDSRVIPEWALTVFRHYMHAGRFAREARITTNIAHLSAARLKTVEFPIPPIHEQRRIVAILEEHLSDLDAAAAYLKSAESRVVRLRAAELERLFGSPGRASLLLSEVIAGIAAGKSFGAADRPALPTEWGIIKVSAMTWGEFRPNENKSVRADRVDPRFEIRPRDLLVSRANTSEYVGASVLVPFDVRPRLLLSDKSLRVTPAPDVNPEWLWRALQAPSARRQMSTLATGTKESMRNISQPALKNVLVPLVSRGDQDSCVAAFSELESTLGRQGQLIGNLKSRAHSLRRAVLAAAFSGRLTGRGSDTDVIEEFAKEESA